MDGTAQKIVAAGMTWIERAHDVTGRRGISAGYDLATGWQPAYPETSGYLLPTMLRAARVLDRAPLADRAVEVGRWLREIQLPDGAFPNLGLEGQPAVFDAGQIVLGLVALWRRTEDPALLESAARAGRWVGDMQRADGSWLSHLGFPNTYSSRVAWALAELSRATGDPAYARHAERSLDWILTRVRPDGWIDAMAFEENRAPWTHTIGYALRGLLRGGDLVGGDLGARCVAAASDCALRLADLRSPLHPLLPGEIGPGFEPYADYACLTGDAQMVVVWWDVAARRGDRALAQRCLEVMDRLAALQVWQPLEPAAVGALPGSWPQSGAFEPNAFPIWATKFLVDAALATSRSPVAT
ncbi:hypothetical protein Acy02nite_86140 [Actinoplanes cyaneus]|uniref:Prenyltransferase n=2 Tax=Actinoplanes cyaneus TaxID=52696 RepID=A0A919MAN9_9ACTN|nr:hypothetical protein [Actinoplanes cyaneus]MCW2144051.1 hypothetical protein [Actinoplanes cyaneus]GID70733.1 hypothetical protein Acy02nite_86140 [Actinoplanes cyaneus]